MLSPVSLLPLALLQQEVLPDSDWELALAGLGGGVAGAEARRQAGSGGVWSQTGLFTFG